MYFSSKKGFSLVEVLVVVAIIGVLASVLVIGSAQTRKVSRDEQRKFDLAQIREGLEEFRSDCGFYLSLSTFECKSGYGTSTTIGCNPPGAGPVTGNDFIANHPTAGRKTCLSSNVYINKVPLDPLSPARRYRYGITSTFPSGDFAGYPTSYIICAALENAPSPGMDASKLSQCGGNCGVGVSCNYFIESPM